MPRKDVLFDALAGLQLWISQMVIIQSITLTEQNRPMTAIVTHDGLLSV